ncbi:MAG: FKBP-type peptidyl-prolyl cis-trans isomerase [Verrucomicrobia bacterium]|nr:FKBP-type peptidyl-prolyl cis-trans isomerase [Verrucomicrobiota bacterium]
MNKTATTLAILAGLAVTANLQAQDSKPFKDEKEKASYAVGLNLGSNWKRQDIDLDFDQVLRGLKDTRPDAQPLLTEEEAREVLTKFQQQIMAAQQEKRRVQGEKNKQAGAAFLAENKSKPGVKTLENGLQYKVITEGSGDIPKREDTVTVKYRGTLIDGTEFDSSEKAPNGTATFRVNGVIRGWTEALTQMKVGSKWQLVIPPDLAYGERGSGPNIGPESTLIFDVELLSVQPAPPPAQPKPLTSDIIKVPSVEEMKKGAKIETIKAEDVEKLQKQQQEQPKQ